MDGYSGRVRNKLMFFRRKDLQYEQDARVYIGSQCRVMTQDNQVLFVGVIQDYDPGEKELAVGLKMGTCAYDHIAYNTSLKIHVLSKRYSDPIDLLYVRTKRYHADTWILQLDQIISQQNRRENFRMQISVDGCAYAASMRRCECRLVDISLTGVLISCAERFALHQEFVLAVEQLRPGGVPYMLKCRVCRVLETPPFSYGCQFIQLTKQQEQQIYQDMFALQLQEIRAMRHIDDDDE